MGATSKSRRHATDNRHLLSGLEGVMVTPFMDEDQVTGQRCTCKLLSYIRLSKERPRHTLRNRIYDSFRTRELLRDRVHCLRVGPHRCPIRS